MAVNLGEIQARLTLDKGNFDSGLSKASKNLKMGTQAALAFSAAVAGASAAMAKKAVSASASFESAITEAGIKVQATSEQLNRMEEAAISAGQASKFTATESAEAMTFLGQAGFDAAQQIEALPDVLELASAENMNVAQTADIASNIMQGFGKSASEVNDIADLLVKTSQTANTNVQELGQAMSFAAPAARSAGISMSETAAAVGALSNSGIKAGRAGRALRKIMSKLQPVSDELGAGLTRSQIASEGLAGSLEELQDSGLNAGNAMDHFGARHGTTVQAILQQGIPAFKDLTKEVEDNADAAGDAADKQLDTLQGKFSQLSGSVDVALTKMGDELKPTVKGLTDIMRAHADQVSAANSSWKTFVEEGATSAIEAMQVAGAAFGEAVGVFEEGQLQDTVRVLKERNELVADAIELRKEGFIEQPTRTVKGVGVGRRITDREVEADFDELSRKRLAGLVTRGRVRKERGEQLSTQERLARRRFEEQQGTMAQFMPGVSDPRQSFQKDLFRDVFGKGTVFEGLKNSVDRNSKKTDNNTMTVKELLQTNKQRAVQIRKQVAKQARGPAAGIISQAKQTAQQKGQAGRQQFRSMMNQVAASPTFKTMKEAGKTLLVASDKLNEAGNSQKNASDVTRQGVQATIGKAQSAFSLVSGLANSIAGATGGGKVTGGITGALSKGLGGAATGAGLGGPVGAAVGGGVGLLTGAISAMSGQTAGQRQKAQQRRERRRMIERQAARIAERMGEEMEERQLQARVIQIDASGALMGSEREQAQALGDLLENEVGRREGLNL